MNSAEIAKLILIFLARAERRETEDAALNLAKQFLVRIITGQVVVTEKSNDPAPNAETKQ